MARLSDPALPLAESALAARLASQVPLNSRGYCARPEDNLIASVDPAVWKQARLALEAGSGTELAGKFCAAYSSAALAVNTFGPLVEHVSLPGGPTVRGSVKFEQARSAWAPGRQPTLDVIVEDEGSEVRLFVESKCVEFLRSGTADFSEAFVKHARAHLGAAAVSTYERLYEDPYAFDPLEARQLAKHFLAAKRVAVESSNRCQVVLLCINWEPQDAAAHPAFTRHRDAVADFAAAVADDDVTVRGMTYRQLWDHWDSLGDPALSSHTSLLRQRYDVRLIDTAPPEDRP